MASSQPVKTLATSIPPSSLAVADGLTNSTSQHESNYLAQAEIAMEYASLRNKDHLPLGMVVLPSPNSLFLWEGVLFVHQGYYAKAVIKFHIMFPDDYPERIPTVKFTTDIYHPLVSSEDGTLSMSTRFSPWRPKQDHIFDVLHFIKLAFKKQTLDGITEPDCPNKEAYKYHNATASFAGLAIQAASLSSSGPALFDSSNYKQVNSSSRKSGKIGSDIFFREVHEEELASLKSKLGIIRN